MLPRNRVSLLYLENKVDRSSILPSQIPGQPLYGTNTWLRRNFGACLAPRDTWSLDSLELADIHFRLPFSSSASPHRSQAERPLIGGMHSLDKPAPLTILPVHRRTLYPHRAYTTSPPPVCPWARRCRRHTCHQFGNLLQRSHRPQNEDRSTDPANPDPRWMRLSCTSAALQWGSCTHRCHVRAFLQRCMLPMRSPFQRLSGNAYMLRLSWDR